MATLIQTTPPAATESPRRRYRVSGGFDDMAIILSSPISSYEIKQDDPKIFTVKHKLTLEERFQQTKNKLNARVEMLWDEYQRDKAEHQRDKAKLQDVETRLRIIEVERTFEKNVILEWETKSRVAQGFNDYYIYSDSFPWHEYELLKRERCEYLPYLLSMWAVFQGRDPAPRFNVSREEEAAYISKVQSLLLKDFRRHIERIWHAIEQHDRNIMIAMYLSRPAALRKETVHLMPSIMQAMNVLDGDERLSPVERGLAVSHLPTLVDKWQQALFSP